LQNHGKDPALRQQAGRAYSIIGEIHFLFGRHADAEQSFQKALELQRKLADKYPHQLEYKLDLIWTHHDRYYNYRDRKALDEAEAVIKEILAIREQLVGDHSKEIAYYRELANSYHDLSDIYQMARKSEESLEAYRQVTRAWERLLDQYPANSDFAVDLAWSYDQMGGRLNERGRTLDALEWKDRAILALEGLLEKEPRNNRARILLRNAHSGRAWIFEGQGRDQQARAEWERAIELDRGAVGAAAETYRMNVDRILARTGEHAKAVVEAQALTSPAWVNVFLLRDAAGVFAVSSTAALGDSRLPESERRKLAQQYADQAVDCLKKARAAGYFSYDEAARIEGLRTDMNLDALRQRPDFQELIRSFHPTDRPKWPSSN
jgi:tetratricopeptide (TPR) repeat protein